MLNKYYNYGVKWSMRDLI